MPYRILTYPDPILRQKAEPIERIDAEVEELARQMASLMYEHQGVGLAAPQVGAARRLVVIDCDYSDGKKNLRVLINPVIQDRRSNTTYEEGCLSIPGFYTKVPRALEVTIRAKTLQNETIEISSGGLLAIVLQHEIDHLDGILILDYLERREREKASQLILEGHYERELARSRRD